MFQNQAVRPKSIDPKTLKLSPTGKTTPQLQTDSTSCTKPQTSSANQGLTCAAVIPPRKVLSNKSLTDWSGSVTTFAGFTGTRPVDEHENVSWDKVSTLLRPDKPAILADKKDGQYVVPCQLKVAPLVGNTLEAANKNRLPTTGKMRSKQHVTEASLLIMDIDGLPEAEFKTGLAKIEGDGLTFLAYTTHSHGRADKPGIRARIVIPLDRPVNTDEYSAAWHGFDQMYWNGQAGKADSSGANMYQQQGAWCCDPTRLDEAKPWKFNGGVVSADTLIAIGKPVPALQPTIRMSQQKSTDTEKSSEYPPSDANKIADACKQIGKFRDAKGAGQSEPQWRACLGVVVFCVNGEEQCQEWSSGYGKYNERETAEKLASRMKASPTTCAQFQKTSPEGCVGCAQQCNSPITLGWEDAFKVIDTAAKDCSVTGSDPSSPEKDEEVIERLASLKPLEYDRVRQETAKALGVQVKTLDEEVKAARKEESGVTRLPFPEVEPYPEPVDPAQVFNDVTNIIRRFIVLDMEQAEAAALWVAHTYLVGVFDTSPLAIINAPERACAKTLLQTVLARMSYRPLSASNTSASALFRAVEVWMPTMFFDEADTFFRDNSELQGMVNAGYRKLSS